MAETELARVQPVAEVSRKHVRIFMGDSTGRVEPISHEGETGGRQVNSYLMWPAGHDLHLHQGRVFPRLDHPDVAPSRLPTLGESVHSTEEGMRYRANGLVYGERTLLRSTLDQGAVEADDFGILPRRRQFRTCQAGAGEEHDARRTSP